MMSTSRLHFLVLVLSLSLVESLKVNSVYTDSDQPTEDFDLSSTGLQPNNEHFSNLKVQIFQSENQFNSQDMTLHSNPANSQCRYLPSDTSENLKDYENLFSIGSGKKILLQGDSLMGQLYHSIPCASKKLGMYAKVNGDKTLIKRSEHEADETALEINLRAFFQFLGIPEIKGAPKQFRAPAEELCTATSKYDYVFANLGHHEVRGDSEWTFEKKANTIFEQTKACGLANNSHFSWVGHPPSHFKNSINQDGGFITGGENTASMCSCHLPHLEQQANIRNSRFAKQAAEKHGFQYISIWEDFKDKCDMHPFDCQHYMVSPTLFAPVIRKITATMQP